MAAMNIVRGEPDAPGSLVSAAQQRAERIRSHLSGAAEEYAAAVLEGDWRVLGYDSVAAWAADQFGQHKFTPDARRKVAELLSARGKTVREIAAATGVSPAMATKDIKASSPAQTQSRVHKVNTSSPRQQAARQREGRRRQEPAAVADRPRAEDDPARSGPGAGIASRELACP